MTKTPVYESYTAAKARCENPSHPTYKYYGARGILFLWPDFETFFAEMGHPPDGGTLERIDNDGNYAPGNCRWATRIEQANNRRSNRRLTAFGSSQTVAQWAREFNIHYVTFRNRLSRGMTVEQALTAPPGARSS
jgi:hypothetical protein